MGTDVLSRFLRVVPVRSKIAPDAAKAFKKMIEKVQLQKIWSDKGTEYKGAFKKKLAIREENHIFNSHRNKVSFAERNFCSLKNIMYKRMENKWTYLYISKLSQFVSTINPRESRVTKLVQKTLQRSTSTIYDR